MVIMLSRLRVPLHLWLNTRSISSSCCCPAWSSRSPVKPQGIKRSLEKNGDSNSEPVVDPEMGKDRAKLSSLRNAPLSALLLGAGGLIPFVAPSIGMLASGYYVPFLHEAQMIYGATILSFLGGARWGLAVTPNSGVELSWKTLGYSVIPPLFAWLAVTMAPGIEAKTALMITGLTFALFHDLFAPGYTPWFKALRLILTAVATLGLAFSNIAFEQEKLGHMEKYDISL